MILELKNISKKFGGVTAINDTSFHVNESEIFGLIGPNGAGKTTMFNIITGNYEPSGGEVKFNAVTLNGKKPNVIVKHGIARTFQNIRLFSSMSVLENVLIGFDGHIKYSFLESILRIGRFHKEEKIARQKAMHILDELNLSRYANEPATSLSYGVQRKVEIARAMATNPKLLLLDEPAAGMNPIETDDLAKLIFMLREKYKLSILLIEHDMKFVNHLCERVLVLDYGKVIFEGKPSEAVKDEKVIAAYLGDFVND
ncbi:ABC transporter ATP-binding protein [Campylobacter sp.]|uniref:ABC transporter ATP-binding protein n=1 Tax=Campylobacter sp. TaxID=205 RepID=UPI00270E004C|nr:ABC transporter ATP-binding protein [Campylobacter sp.]